MPQPTDPRAHPATLLAQACAEYGEDRIARWCADLLADRIACDDPAAPPLTWLGGTLDWVDTDSRDPDRRGGYWPRVWGARGLLYAWTPTAVTAVVVALADPAWRVREMACKVVVRRSLGEACDLLPPLCADPVPRVRSAAARALGEVADGDAAPNLHTLAADDDPRVARAAGTALDRMRRRLDRPL